MCDSNANCNNTIGSYECICNDGYNGTGFVCSGKLFKCTDKETLHVSVIFCTYQIMMSALLVLMSVMPLSVLLVLTLTEALNVNADLDTPGMDLRIIAVCDLVIIKIDVIESSL